MISIMSIESIIVPSGVESTLPAGISNCIIYPCSKESDMTKQAFSHSDVLAINKRLAAKLAEQKRADFGLASSALPSLPPSPIAARMMREVDVSTERMSEAYRVARETVLRSK